MKPNEEDIDFEKSDTPENSEKITFWYMCLNNAQILTKQISVQIKSTKQEIDVAQGGEKITTSYIYLIFAQISTYWNFPDR